jgi:hypothetical protein
MKGEKASISFRFEAKQVYGKRKNEAKRKIQK